MAIYYVASHRFRQASISTPSKCQIAQIKRLRSQARFPFALLQENLLIWLALALAQATLITLRYALLAFLSGKLARSACSNRVQSLSKRINFLFFLFSKERKETKERKSTSATAIY